MQPLTIYISHTSEIFTDNRAHGDGLVAYAFVSKLAERGHRLHVAAQDVDLKYPLHPNVTVHLMRHRTRNQLIQRVEFAFRSRRLLQRLLRSERIDVIHQLNPVFAGLSVGLASFGIPIVLGPYGARWPADPDAITSGDGALQGMLRRIHLLVARVQQKQAAAIILSTPAAEVQLPDKAALAGRIHVVPYGTACDFYTPAPDWNAPARLAAEQARPIILFLASLNVRKGIYDLLDAFEIVAREFPDCRLRIVGNGPEQSGVYARVESSSASTQIEMLPAQPRLATVQHFRDCTIFCSPSLGEPFGMAVCEAMACARPVVVTAAAGHLYTVNPSGGALVPMQDCTALADALLRLLRDPEERLRMSHFNRQWVEEQFAWDALIHKVENIYAQVVLR